MLFHLALSAPGKHPSNDYFHRLLFSLHNSMCDKKLFYKVTSKKCHRLTMFSKDFFCSIGTPFTGHFHVELKYLFKRNVYKRHKNENTKYFVAATGTNWWIKKHVHIIISYICFKITWLKFFILYHCTNLSVNMFI